MDKQSIIHYFLQPRRAISIPKQEKQQKVHRLSLLNSTILLKTATICELCKKNKVESETQRI